MSDCEKVNEIEIINQTTNCYRDVPIFIEKEQQKITAFLTNNGIIRKHSSIVDCAEKRIIATPNTEWRIVKIGNVSRAINSSQNFAAIQFLINNKNTMNWTHNLQYLEKFDVWQTLSSISKSRDDNNIFMTHEIGKTKQETLNEVGKAFFERLLEITKSWLRKALIFISVLLVIFICFIFRVQILKTFCCKARPRNRPRQDASTFMSRIIFRKEEGTQAEEVNINIQQDESTRAINIKRNS
jgi:hypothetical protein